MAGHSHAKTTKYRKNGQDAKRSKIFTKLQREIFIAVKTSGSDEKFNPKLRLARQKARLCNMPNDKIQDAIKRANNAEANSSNYEECYYLISSSGGVFILVKTVTDNKNRSASDVRGVVGRYKMSIGESSAIDFLFENIGIIKYEKTENNFDAIFEKAIECGAKDVTEAEILEETDEEEIASPAVQIVCEFKDFNSVKTSLEETFGEAKIAETVWVAKNKIEINEERRITMQKVIDELEELDDVSTIYTNF